MTSRVTYRSKTDLVAEAIKEMIHSGELKRGAELHQRAIAERLGVSPTPVREAMRRLEAEGYLAIEPHQPAIVMGSDESNLEESAIILGTLEGLGAELAAKRVRPGDIEALKEINGKLGRAASHTERIELDRQFHARICEITGSTILLAQLKLLWRTVGDAPSRRSSTSQWVRDHKSIIDALEVGDCSEARDATNSHALQRFQLFDDRLP